jgi:hypothetical protein
MRERIIAGIGLCAAAGVFAASLGILVFQSGRIEASQMRPMTPAQIEPAPSSGQAADHVRPQQLSGMAGQSAGI